MARPTKLTEEVINDVMRRLLMGGSISAACEAAGISKESFHRWRRLVRDGKGTRIQKRFVKAVTEAQAEIKNLCESGILAAGKKNWQAFAWLLERRYPDEYARRYRDSGTGETATKVVGARFSLWPQDSSKPEQEPSSSESSTTTPRSEASDDSTY